MNKKLILLIIVFGLCSFNAFAGLLTGLNAYYKLDNNYNDETNNYDATGELGVTFVSDSILGSYASHFDGDKEVNLGTPMPTGNSARSLSLWVNFSGFILSGSFNNIIFRAGNYTIDSPNARGEKFIVAISTNEMYIARQYDDIRFYYDFNETDWYHIVLTYPGTKTYDMKLYVNGVEVANSHLGDNVTLATTNNQQTLSTENFYTNDVHWRGIDGIIDEVGIWSRALTSSEVTTLYNSGDGYSYDDFNVAPTTPTSLSLTNPVYVGDTLTATGSGSTDADSDAITYYYKFMNGATERQAYSTDNTYVIVAGDAHDTMTVSCIANDGLLNSSGNYSANRVVSNTLPTTPSGSSLSASDQNGETLTATGAGSTDADSDAITYKYQFRCDSVSGTILQAQSTDTTYVIDTSGTCGAGDTIYVLVWSNDGTGDSTAYETETKLLVNSPPAQVTSWTFPSTNPYSDRVNITFNWSSVTDPDLDAVQYLLFINDSLYYQGLDTNWTSNFTDDAEYNYIVGTYDGLLYGTNSTQRTYILDTVTPQLSINSQTDNTSIYYTVSTIPINVTFNDTNLYGFNVTCYYNNGTMIYSNQTVGITTTSLEYYKSLNTISASIINCTAIVADDHTVKDFDVKIKKEIFGIGKNKLSLDDGNIEVIIDDKDLESLDYIKEKDKITPIFKFKNNKNQIKWQIKYKGKADKRELSDYIEHYVILPNSNLQSGYWVDGEDDYNSIVTSYVEGDTIYYSAIPDKPIKEYKTKSLGGLNTANESWSFTVQTGQNVTFTGYNIWNLSNVPINVSLSNGTNYSGNSVYLETNCSNITINFSSQNYMNNYIINSYNCNLSSSYNKSFWQTEVTVTAYNNITNNSALNSNIQVNDSSLSNVSLAPTGQVTFYLNNGTDYSFNTSAATYSASNINVSQFTFNTNNNVSLYMNREYSLFLYREQTGELFNLTETGATNYTVTLDVYCDNKAVRHTITSTDWDISNVDCDFDYWYITLISSTDSYYRTIKPSLNSVNVSAYLLDLKDDTAVQIILSLNDLVNAYNDGYITVKKYINETLQVVIKQQFDIEDKVILWLDQNEQYEIYSENDNGVETFIGDLVADSAGEKSLILPGIPLSWDYSFEEVFFHLAGDKDTGTVKLYYVDYTSVGYNNLTWTIYRFNNSQEVYRTSLINGFNQTLTATGLESNDSYYTNVYIDHNNNVYDYNLTRPVWYATHNSFPGFEDWAIDIKLFFGVGLPLLILLASSTVSSLFLAPFAGLILVLFRGFGWLKPIQGQALRYFTGLYTIDIFISLFATFLFIQLIKHWKNRK